MDILEVSDYSWYPCLENQKKQARICVAIKMKPVLMDINTCVGVGPAISSLDSVDIPRSELLPSAYTTIVLRRGKKLHQLPVLGQTDLIIHHARGRTFRQTTSIKLERDAKPFNLKTLVVESFPKECKFQVLAGHDFLEANYLRLDVKNAQIVNILSYPAKTVIQFMHPNPQYYLRSHTLFWERHYKPKTKSVKIVPPKFCENCGTHFRQIKKNEKFEGKYQKGEMILYHGEVDYFPCTLGLSVRSYSNNHIIKAVLKKARTKMVLSVPECAVRRKEENVSTVLPEKFNKKESSSSAIIPKMGAIKTEKSCDKTDVSTQTCKLPNEKRRALSKIKSEFTECLYPFTLVENWVNGCPSQYSEVMYDFPHNEEVPDAQANYADIPKHLLVTIPDRCFRFHHDAKDEDSLDSQHGFYVGSEWYRSQDDFEHRNPSRLLSPSRWPEKMNSPGPDCNYVPDYMDIPEQHRLVTNPSRCFNLKQDNVPGYTRVKRRNADDEYVYNCAPDEYVYNCDPDEYNRDKMMDTPGEFDFNCASEDPNVDDYSSAHDVYNMDNDHYSRLWMLPNRMSRSHYNAMQGDFLGDAGGEEELRQSMTNQFLYDDDHPWPDHS